MADDGYLDPYVTVARTGRWSYLLTVHEGMFEYDSRFVLGGRRRAEKMARRHLAAHLRRKAYQADVTKIRSG